MQSWGPSSTTWLPVGAVWRHHLDVCLGYLQPDPQKLTELENRIARMKAATAPKPAKDEHYTMANMAWRMVIELVAGIAIGFGIGYGLDWLFGTLPIFLILFIGLGFVAGVRTMMRTAQEVQNIHLARAADEKEG